MKLLSMNQQPFFKVTICDLKEWALEVAICDLKISRSTFEIQLNFCELFSDIFSDATVVNTGSYPEIPEGSVFTPLWRKPPCSAPDNSRKRAQRLRNTSGGTAQERRHGVSLLRGCPR